MRRPEAVAGPRVVPKPVLSAEIADHALDAFDHARQALGVNLVRRVARLMVVGITKRRRVRDHHGLKAVLGEGPMIRPADAGNEAWRDAADGRERRMRAE